MAQESNSEKAKQLHDEILQFKAFYNGLLNERMRLIREIDSIKLAHLKESGITPESVIGLEERAEKGRQLMYEKSLELHKLGYALTWNGEDIEPFKTDEDTRHTKHAVYGFLTQQESIYKFAQRMAGNRKR